MTPKIELLPANDLPRELTEKLFGWFYAEWELQEHTTSPASWRILIWAEDELVGHVGIVEREGTINGLPVQLCGIAGVYTSPEWRGSGFASQAMRMAQAHMREKTDAEFGLLLCADFRVSFYAALGWQEMTAPLSFTRWNGAHETWDNKVMILPLRDRALPDGPIDLCGMDW